MTTLPRLSVHEIARQCGNGRKSSRSVVEHYLSAIAAENGKLHAFIEVFAPAALRRADELDRLAAQSGPVGPLHGVPIAVKDLAHFEGRTPGFGSRCYHPPREARTAPAIQRLIDAGAIVIGMTHMVEFASGGWGTNRTMGTPWNPVDRAVHRVPGGSSSGSAVAVAARLAPAAIGSDTGGSIRIPAALCGIVGFKPSFGLIPLEGIAPLGPSFDTLGPLGSDVADMRLLFSVLAARVPEPGLAGRKLRIGVPSRGQLEPCDAEILANFERSLAGLRAHGHVLETIRMPHEMSDYQALNGRIVAYEAYRYHRARAEDAGNPIDPFVKERVLAGREIEDRDYADMIARLRAMRAGTRATLGPIDILAFPTTPLPAVPVSSVDESTITMSRFTRMGNCLDLPAISLPNGVTAEGLPTGLQLMSWSGQDALVLALAEEMGPSPQA